MTVDDPARELRRVVDRCRTLSLARWGAPTPEGRTPAELVHHTCCLLANLAADGEGRPRRDPPVLRPHGLADQVSVLAADALVSADAGEVARILADLRRVL